MPCRPKMASSTKPSTPERSHPAIPYGPRRSFTLPTKLSQPQVGQSDAVQPSPDTVENLFTHTGCKIVSFSTSSRATGRDASFTDPGTLSWTSITERTVAAGPLLIYRVPGSVSFINSGNILQAVLPRSQCWCVDDASTFVFRVRPDSYYRIELPNDTPVDKEKIEEIKSVFNNILLYEKTACPFRKGALNELPEEPETPTPRGRLKPTGRARKWNFDKVWQPEDADGRNGTLSDFGSAEYSDSDASLSTSTSMDTHDASVTSDTASPNVELGPEEDLKPLTRPKPSVPLRSITAPPQLILQASPSSKAKEQNDDIPSLSSSLDSFHSVNSQVYHPANEEINSISEETDDNRTPTLAPPSHSRGVSDVTLTDEPDAFSKSIHVSSPLDDDVEGSVPSTPTLLSDTEERPASQASEIVTPPDTLRLRQPRKARYRSVSPFSQDATSFLVNTRPQNQHLTSTIIRKTYEILMSPPSHLISMMLRIAARIAGSISLAASDFPVESNNRIPCSWESEEEGIDWEEEDDYSFRLRPLKHPLSRNSE